MKRLLPILLFLFTLTATIGCGNDLQDGLDAANKGDYKTALEKLKPLAEKGSSKAQSNLGVMYRNGDGVTQNYKEAVKWYRLSAEQGHAPAQSNLGQMYKFGYGVKKDYVEAYKWYYIAGANGNEKGRKNRDSIEKKMTPAQIDEAQKLAKEWMEKHKR